MTILISLLLLQLGAVLLCHKSKLSPAASLLATICGSVLFLWLLGMIGLLQVAGYIIFLLPLLGTGWLLHKESWTGFRQALGRYFTLPVVLFTCSAVVFTVIFAVGQPHFYYWDEFSFWGISAKIVQCSDKLYTVVDGTIDSFSALRSYPCGNALLSYLFQFFSSNFVEYRLLLSYAFLFFSVFSAATEVVLMTTKKTSTACLLYFGLLLTPFWSIYHAAHKDYSSLSYAYGTAMADFTLAVVFLGVMVLYLAAPKGWWYLFPLALLANLKDVGLLFALLGGALVAVFEIFSLRAKNVSLSRHASSYKAIRSACALLIGPTCYLMWGLHLHLTQPVVVQTAGSGALRYDLSSQAGGLLQSLFSASSRSDRLINVLAQMKISFLTEHSTPLGPDVLLVAILLFISVFAVAFAQKKQRFPLGIIFLLLPVGALGYTFFVSYFMAQFPEPMIEYGRYMSSYYFGWIYLVLFLSWWVLSRRPLCQDLLACACAALGLITVGTIHLDHTVIAAPDNAYEVPLRTNGKVAAAQSMLSPGDRVYLVYQLPDTFLQTRFFLYPALLDLPAKTTELDFTLGFSVDPDGSGLNTATPQEFAELMRDNFDYILFVEPSETFTEDYGSLFAGELAPGALFTVGSGRFEPVEVAK